VRRSQIGGAATSWLRAFRLVVAAAFLDRRAPLPLAGEDDAEVAALGGPWRSWPDQITPRLAVIANEESGPCPCRWLLIAARRRRDHGTAGCHHRRRPA